MRPALRNTLVTGAILATVACSADARGSGFNLTWDKCLASGGVASKTIDCADEFGVNDIVVTFRSDVTLPAFTGIRADLDIVSNTSLAEWWQLGPGGCNTSLAASLVRPSGSTACPTLWGTTGSNGSIIAVTEYPVFGDPKRARIAVIAQRPLASTSTVVAGTEYFAFRLQLFNDSAPFCVGCEQPVAIVASNVTLLQNTVCTGPKNDTPLAGPLVNGCIVANGGDCAWAESFSVDYVIPPRCLPLGTVDLRLVGTGFEPGMTARLLRSGESPIAASAVSFVGAFVADATFDIGGAAPGPWDVEVTLPDLRTAMAPAAFTVGTLDGVWPNRAVNNTTVTVDIAGCGFAPGATVRLALANQPDIDASSVSVLSSSSIEATFAFNGETPGKYDVIVTEPNGRSVTLLAGFQLEVPIVGNMVSSLTGPVRVRPNWSATWQFRLRLLGNQLWNGLSMVRVRAIGPITSVQARVMPANALVGTFAPTLDGTDAMVGLFTLPDLPFQAPGTGYDFKAAPSPLWPIGDDVLTLCTQLFQSRSSLTHVGRICARAVHIGGARLGFTWPAVGASFETEFHDALALEILNRIDLFTTDPATHPGYAQHALLLSASVDAALAAVAPNYPVDVDVYGGVWDQMKEPTTWAAFVLKLDEDYDAIPPPLINASLFPMAERCHAVDVLGSMDPNDKYGPAGPGAQHYIDGLGELPYTIVFENLPSATAAAQDVFVTDTLDVTRYDLSTFQLGRITFGSHVVEPPPGLRSFTTEVDLRPAMDLLVGIDAGLDLSTGVLGVAFRSLDPVTGGPPTDPLAGFLPPDVNYPEGAGGVSYTVALLPGLPSGTTVANWARIVFDTNPHIDTPVWSNTLDFVPPASQVDALPAQQGPGAFNVSWSGSDDGAGILDYSVFVSTDGGPFVTWRENTTSTADVYPGEAGHSYALYSVARDPVGNIEDAPSSPDAMTQIVLGVAPPVFELSLAGAAPNPSRGTLRVAFTLPDDAPASVEVLDVAGRRVVRRSVGALGAGRHHVDLGRGGWLAPGIYHVRLIRSGRTLERRAVLLK